MTATEQQIRDLAATIADQAQAIRDGTLTGPLYAHARLIRNNAETLAAWAVMPGTEPDASSSGAGGPVTTERTMWTYKGTNVWPADRNSAGIRWYAHMSGAPGTLRADTKDGMRELITHYTS